MAKKVGHTKQQETSKKMSTTKHHIAVNNTKEPGGKIGENSPNTNTWYHVQEIKGQKWVVLDGKLIPKRNAILDSFSNRFKNQSPWDVK